MGQMSATEMLWNEELYSCHLGGNNLVFLASEVSGLTAFLIRENVSICSDGKPT